MNILNAYFLVLSYKMDVWIFFKLIKFKNVAKHDFPNFYNWE